MRTPGFLRLVEIDEQHFITACRHGLVHLTWGRCTIRFARDEFQRLAALLDRALDSLPPVWVGDGELRVTYRSDEASELRVEPVVLLLSPPEFSSFVQAVREATDRLMQILASGVWDREEEPQDSTPGSFQPIPRIPFSRN